jgi:hypothetical protein
MQEETAVEVFPSDAGSRFGWRESLNWKEACQGDGNVAGVEDARSLVELRLAEDGDAEEIAGPDEETFRGARNPR